MEAGRGNVSSYQFILLTKTDVFLSLCVLVVVCVLFCSLSPPSPFPLPQPVARRLTLFFYSILAITRVDSPRILLPSFAPPPSSPQFLFPITRQRSVPLPPYPPYHAAPVVPDSSQTSPSSFFLASLPRLPRLPCLPRLPRLPCRVPCNEAGPYSYQR